jgi:histidinol-phosphate aminotransferase
MSQYIKESVKNLKPYTSARDMFTGDYVFLDANENPAQWLELDQELLTESINRYPDSKCLELRQLLVNDIKSELTNFSPISKEQIDSLSIDNVFIGRGGDEVIDRLIRVFVDAGQSIMMADPSYSVYEVQADINDVGCKKILLNKDFSLNIESIKENIEGVNLLFLCTPNNPTGNLISGAEFDEIREFYDGPIAIDEAYIEFAGYENSLLEKVFADENTVVFRTFSKAYGLAGIRVGYCIGGEAIVEALMKVKDSYNQPHLSQYIAIKALENKAKMQACVDTILNDKKELIAYLEELGFEIIPTVTNWVNASITNATQLYKDVAELGIIVRDRSNLPHLDGVLRITVGTKEENQKLIEAIKKSLNDA